MTQPVALTVPEKIVAGTTVKFQRSFADYPASDGWTYAIYFIGAQKLTKAGVANGAAFDVTLAITDTDDFTTAGAVRYQEQVSKAGEVYSVGEGTTVVELNYITAAAGATQTFEEKTLAVIEAALSGRLTSDTQSYQIGGRQVIKIPVEELIKLRNQFAYAVRYQRTGEMGSTIYAEFGNPAVQ
jgi:hypothetical protein